MAYLIYDIILYHVDLRGEHFHRFLVYLHPIRLLIRLWLGNGSAAAAPGVEHHGVLLALLQHLVEVAVGRQTVKSLTHEILAHNKPPPDRPEFRHAY